ncbi:MAG: DUF5818 domain-containing protein [Candidatus Sulfotelmatobacter sp.]
MRRTASCLVGLFLFLCSAFAFAQNPAESAAQARSEQLPQILGPQLIAWSELQKPQPVPTPLPPPERADQPSNQTQTQPGDSSAQPSSSQPTDSDAQQHASTQNFTGTIVRNGKEYMLKMSDRSAYQLDDPEKAKPYEGKQVKVAGKLDPKSNVLHVLGIELMS